MEPIFKNLSNVCFSIQLLLCILQSLLNLPIIVLKMINIVIVFLDHYHLEHLSFVLFT